MDEFYEPDGRLFELLGKLNDCLASDRGEEALEVVRTIKKEGETLKKSTEEAKTLIEKKLKMGEAELKLSEDKYKELEEKKEEASRQLDGYKITQIVSGLAIANFDRDEQKGKEDLEQARHELQIAENEVKRLEKAADSLFTRKVTMDRMVLAVSRLKLAHDRVKQAENQLKATKRAKEKHEKAGREAKERYAGVKKEYKEWKAQMQTIWEKWGDLKIAVAFALRACAELQIVLGLTENACSSTKELKRALNREFSRKAIGADEDPTYLPIPVSRITKGRFSATKELWQYFSNETSRAKTVPKS